ncbi:molybdate ABC transporter substrate-binding protein [Vibrio sp. FNV 38]|nr:molybdate ABC transporter substrate-binding protein [Vibrio sp. FNV 38]
MLFRFFLTIATSLSLSVQAQESVTVFAAASMTDALDEIAQKFEHQTGTQVKRSYASSSVLARQIAQGAPADIFISANQRWMEYLIEIEAVDQNSVKPLVRNQLVAVMPGNLESKPVVLDDATTILKLLQGTRLAVGDPKHVPAGIYTQQAFESLGMWQQLLPHLARANNVRAALLWVERQEARVGVVYRTDALVSQRVHVIAQFPESSHEPIVYPVAKVNKAKMTSQTHAFYEFLMTKDAMSVFESFGFVIE